MSCPSLPSVPTAQLVGHDGPINAVSFTADGKYCLTAGHDRTVRLWNPTRRDPSYHHPPPPRRRHDARIGGRDDDDDGENDNDDGHDARTPPLHALPIQTYSDGHTHPVSALAIDSSDATDSTTLLLTASDRAVVVTDLVTSRVLRRFHHGSASVMGGGGGFRAAVNDVAIAAGSEAYLSGGYDGMVRIWDGRSRSSSPIQVLDDAKDSISAVEVVQSRGGGGNGSGGGASVGEGQILAASVDGTLRTYDLRMGQLQCDDVGDSITGMALTRSAETANVGADARGGARGSRNRGRCVALSCLDGTIRLLERDTGELLRTYRGGHSAGTYGLRCDWTFGDMHVVSGSEDGNVILYGLIDGTVVKTLVFDDYDDSDAKWSSTATAYASAVGGSVDGLDKKKKKPTCCVAAHPKREWASVVISASHGGRAVVWSSNADAKRWE